jgi:hypothetical protein
MQDRFSGASPSPLAPASKRWRFLVISTDQHQVDFLENKKNF